MKPFLLLMLAAAAACSGTDPCAAVTKDFLLQGTRFSDQVDMTWSGADAGSYEIWAFGGAHQNVYQNPIATVSESGVNIGLTADLGTVVFESRPVIAGKACPTPDSALSVPLQPTLGAIVQDGGVQLSWGADQAYEPVVQVGRGPDESDIHTLAFSDAGTYFDSTVELSTTYVYAVEMRAKNLIALSLPATVLTPPTAPTVTATPATSQIVLNVQAPSGTAGCEATQQIPASPFGPGEPSGVSGGSVAMFCPLETDCTYEVHCIDTAGRQGPSVTVSARDLPVPPAACTATPLTGGVRIDWSSAPADAASFVVQRVTVAGAATIGTASGNSYTDAAVPPFQAFTYRIGSVSAAGGSGTSFCSTQPAIATNEPDAMNLATASGAIAIIQQPGQVFTVAHGGQLMGIEIAPQGETFGAPCLSLTTTGDSQLPDPVQAGCLQPAAFSPNGSALAEGGVQGSYYDLSSLHVAVSAGETLRFELEGNVSGQAIVSGDVVPGTATTFGGVADPAHDLLFKTFVQPSADLPAPVLTAWPGAQSAFLTWTASPGAVGYDVLDATGAALLRTLDAHASLPISAESTFSVSAVPASGAPAVSSSVTVSPTGLVADAANLCDSAAGAGFGFSIFLNSQVTQTFTAVHSGLLARVELDLVPQSGSGSGSIGSLPLQVQDAAGNLLASATLHAPAANFFNFPPLSTAPALVAVDLSASGVHVTAGQSLRVVVKTGTSPFTLYSFRDSTDLYAGGDEQPPPGSGPRDLCFQVYVDPNR